MLMHRAKWLTGIAVVAVLGSAATPMIASAHQTGGDEVSAKASLKVKTSGALAAALGVEPDVLKAAIQAALEATPKPDGEGRNDPEAREAYRAAFQANVAANLGITVEQWAAAIESLKADQPERDGDGKPGKHDGILGRKLADALGVTPDALAAAVQAARADVPRPAGEEQRDPAARDAYVAALEAAIAGHLGITVEAFDAAQAAARAALQAKRGERRDALDERGTEHFQQVLARLVGAGVLTQEQADAALAQYQQGGREQAQVVKRLRTLLQDLKQQDRDDDREERRERKQDRKGERGPARAGVERLLKQQRADGR